MFVRLARDRSAAREEATAGARSIIADGVADRVANDLGLGHSSLPGNALDRQLELRRQVDGRLVQWLWRAGALSELDARAEEVYRLEVAGRAREAAAAWGQLSVPYEAALSLAGSSDAADVQRAHEELTLLGATAVLRKVALRLRELGSPVPRGPRPTTRSNPRGLTEREWEIARLLALGLSNAEIADRLVVSPKTVGHHVSAVLAKLTVRRRAEVAAAINEVGVPI